MKPDLRRAAELEELSRRMADEGAPAMSDIFMRMSAWEKRGRPDEAMREFLPFIQIYTNSLPLIQGFAVMFTYRLTMLMRGLREAANA